MNRDWFMEAFGAAVSDVREKLMEGWFGRGADPAGSPGHPATIDFGDWLSGDVSPIGSNPDVDLNISTPEQSPGPNPPDLDRGIDL